MIKLLIKLFVKNSEDTDDIRVKKDIALVCTNSGVFFNILLFLSKYFIGVMAGSISMVADAFNNLSDVLSASFSSIAGIFAGRGADKEHPYGHGRIEWISAVAIGILIIFTGIELLRTSVEGILNPGKMEFNIYAVTAMALSIAIKIYIVSYNRRYCKITNSKTLATIAEDAFSDVLASSGVLISLLISSLSPFNIDPYIGIAVSLFVTRAGLLAVLDVLSNFIGLAPSEDIETFIENLIKEKDKSISIHDFYAHDYGYGRTYLSMHMEVEHGYNIAKLHRIISDINYEVQDKMGARIAIQADFVVRDEAVTGPVISALKATLGSIDERIRLENFRMLMSESNCNVEYDLYIPKNLEKIEREILSKTEEALKSIDESYRALANAVFFKK